jgi:hypothetical protein
MRFRVKLVRAVEDNSPISIDYRRRFISFLKKIFEKEFDEEVQSLTPLRSILEKTQRYKESIYWE